MKVLGICLILQVSKALDYENGCFCTFFVQEILRILSYCAFLSFLELTEQELGKQVYSFTDSDCIMEDGVSYDSSSVTDFSDPYFTPVKETNQINKLKDRILSENEVDVPKCMYYSIFCFPIKWVGDHLPPRKNKLKKKQITVHCHTLILTSIDNTPPMQNTIFSSNQRVSKN